MKVKMMKLWRNQKGLTLVELLGALTLVLLISGLIFAALSNSMQFFRAESNRIDIREQVNTIANQLTTFYQKNTDFTITQDGDGVVVKSVTKEGNVETREYAIPNHKITITYTDSETTLYNKRSITISVTGEEEFSLDTVVSRIREGT